MSQNRKERQRLDLFALYSKKEQLYFYDMEWNEELATLKPTGLMALLLGSPYQRMFSNYMFVVDQNDQNNESAYSYSLMIVEIPNQDFSDMKIALSQYILMLTNNYFREVIPNISGSPKI